MSSLPHWLYFPVIVCGACLDIVSNLLLKKSHGFTHKRSGSLAIALMLGAMSCLALAAKGLPLAVAYAVWTSFGVLGTALLGWRLFGQKLRASAWCGIALLIIGIALLYGG